MLCWVGEKSVRAAPVLAQMESDFWRDEPVNTPRARPSSKYNSHQFPQKTILISAVESLNMIVARTECQSQITNSTTPVACNSWPSIWRSSTCVVVLLDHREEIVAVPGNLDSQSVGQGIVARPLFQLRSLPIRFR